MVKLTGRLSAAAALCRRGVTVCDVGTDHALLACYLAQNGAKEVIASDVKEGPLSAARRTIAEQSVTNVTAVLSDGLDRIDYADDVVICGMGGELIMKIISGCRFLSEDTRFILQPMTKADTLRRELYRGGFDIIEERAVREGDRFYTVMLARYTGAAQEPEDVYKRQVNDRGIAGDDLAAVLLEYHAAEVDCDLRELGEYFALHVVGHLFSHV